MTKMSKAQRTTGQTVDNRAEIGAPRTDRYFALVKIHRSFQGARDFLHGEARAEDNRRRVAAARQGRPEVLNGTLGGPEMILAVLPLAIEQAHAEALDEAAERGPAHVRTNCPALPNGGCVRCTAPATVRAAHGDDSAYHSDTQVQLQRLDAEMDALREQYRAINDQLVAAHELRDEVVTARLAELTDEQIMADETLTRWLFRESWSHSGAADRKRVLVRIDAEGAGDPDSYDGRDEYAADVLPPISVALVKGQDVAPLADAIRAWVQRWALGRPDVPVSIMERTLSEHGSYGGMYDIASDTMCLRIIRWGREEELANGPLEEVLAYMASEFWYRKPGADGSWDSQDDEDDDY